MAYPEYELLDFSPLGHLGTNSIPRDYGEPFLEAFPLSPDQLDVFLPFEVRSQRWFVEKNAD